MADDVNVNWLMTALIIALLVSNIAWAIALAQIVFTLGICV